MGSEMCIRDRPAGWVAAGDEIDGSLRTFVFWTSLDANEPGSNATFLASATGKANLTISTFNGVDGTNPIAAIDSTATLGNRAEHLSADLTFTGDATLLHYWAERTSNTTEIFASPELAQLSMEIGFGGGRVNSTLAIDPTLQTASSASAAAVTEHHSFSALGWAVALREGTTGNNTPPGSVTILAPTGTTTTTNPLIQWTPDTNGTATEYRIVIRNNNNQIIHNNDHTLDEITNNNGQLQIDLGLNLAPERHRIWIRGENPTGNGNYTPPTTFTLDG